MQKLKRVVIKEELVAITKDYKRALTLNQLLYWTERVGNKRYNKWIEEETKRQFTDIDTKNLEGGWIYKSSKELSEELMISVTSKTARSYLKDLIDSGFVIERDNPNSKWDNTKQYRIMLLEIRKALNEKDYELQGYKFDEIACEPLKRPDCNNYDSSCNNYDSNQQKCKNNNKDYNTDITTEYKNNICAFDNKCIHLSKQCNKDSNECEVKECPILEVFNYYCEVFEGVFEPRKFTQKRKKKILARLRDDNFTVSELKSAIDNIRRSAYHCGKNENGKVYATIEFIFRSCEKVEQWLQIKKEGNNTNGADKSAMRENDKPRKAKHRARRI